MVVERYESLAVRHGWADFVLSDILHESGVLKIFLSRCDFVGRNLLMCSHRGLEMKACQLHP